MGPPTFAPLLFGLVGGMGLVASFFAARDEAWGSLRARPSSGFPGYDVMRQQPAWDEVTRSVVLARLGPPGPARFFTAEEEPTARALLDRLLAQDEDPRVPVFEVIDARLAERPGRWVSLRGPAR